MPFRACLVWECFGERRPKRSRINAVSEHHSTPYFTTPYGVGNRMCAYCNSQHARPRATRLLVPTTMLPCYIYGTITYIIGAARDARFYFQRIQLFQSFSFHCLLPPVARSRMSGVRYGGPTLAVTRAWLVRRASDVGASAPLLAAHSRGSGVRTGSPTPLAVLCDPASSGPSSHVRRPLAAVPVPCCVLALVREYLLSCLTFVPAIVVIPPCPCLRHPRCCSLQSRRF